jgi:hypothetical protein
MAIRGPTIRKTMTCVLDVIVEHDATCRRHNVSNVCAFWDWRQDYPDIRYCRRSASISRWDWGNRASDLLSISIASRRPASSGWDDDEAELPPGSSAFLLGEVAGLDRYGSRAPPNGWDIRRGTAILDALPP